MEDNIDITKIKDAFNSGFKIMKTFAPYTLTGDIKSISTAEKNALKDLVRMYREEIKIMAVGFDSIK